MNNTLRVILIIFLSFFLICSSLLFALLSMCGIFTSQSSSDRSFAFGVLIAYAFILIGSIFAIVKLVKGMRQEKAAQNLSGPITPDAPVTPANRQIIQFLTYALLAEIVVSILSWTFTLWQSPDHRQWRYLLISFLIYQVPYIFLLWRLSRKLTPTTLAFSLALPAAAVLFSAFRLITTWTWTIGPGRQRFYLTTAVFFTIDLAIFLLAVRLYRQRQTPDLAGWLVFASFASLLYFSAAQLGITLLYRLFL